MGISRFLRKTGNPVSQTNFKFFFHLNVSILYHDNFLILHSLTFCLQIGLLMVHNLWCNLSVCYWTKRDASKCCLFRAYKLEKIPVSFVMIPATLKSNLGGSHSKISGRCSGWWRWTCDPLDRGVGKEWSSSLDGPNSLTLLKWTGLEMVLATKVKRLSKFLTLPVKLYAVYHLIP